MGVGLALAAVAVGAWRRLVVQGMSVERRPLDGAPVEGEPLALEAEVHGRRWLCRARSSGEESVGALGARRGARRRATAARSVVVRRTCRAGATGSTGDVSSRATRSVSAAR